MVSLYDGIKYTKYYPPIKIKMLSKKALIAFSLCFFTTSVFADVVNYSKESYSVNNKYKYNPTPLVNGSYDSLGEQIDYNNSVSPIATMNSYYKVDGKVLPVPIDVSSSPKIENKISNKYTNLLSNSQSLKGCWDGAAKAYNLDPWLLMAVAKVESSFNNIAINKNKNSTYDYGMMQINTIWLPTLYKFGITQKDLLNPCTSVFVGAWILAQNIQRFGYNKDGIGAYNSPGNPTIRRSYAEKVYKAYNEITNDFYYKK